MGLSKELVEFTQAKIKCFEPMKNHTGYRVGGEAKYYAEVDSLYGINLLSSLCKKHKINYKVLGNGTNVLFSDKGFDGLVINFKRLSDVFFKREEVRAMAGASLDKLIKFAYEHRLSGVEALAGIPATVGGAVVMNAGAFGHNISDYITSVETLYNGKLKFYDKEECKFCYRGSRFLGKKEIVVSATFCFRDGERDIISAGIKTYAELRKTMHPTGRSCGSVFKNPSPSSAGALIDRAGLKGFAVGKARISDKHANFIITVRGATATDVYLLIQFIKEKIKNVFDIDLVEEVEFVGEF